MTSLDRGGLSEVYCASPAAIAAATGGYLRGSGHLADPKGLTDALIAAHDHKLGLERSVCLRDVYEVLEREYHPLMGENRAHPADVLFLYFAKADDK